MSSRHPIAHLASVPVEMEVELGRTVMTLGEILRLGRESVIRLPRSASGKVDLRAGGALIGAGEIVMTGNMADFRVTALRSDE